jgi:DNA-binding winged helix-turn-helix (wHTH) protein
VTKQDKYLYPVTPATLHKYAEDIFAPIKRGECVTTVWVPMSGRRMWNKFIIENIHLFEKELPHFDKYLLVYIEPLDLTEESLVGYIRLMAKSFIDVASQNKNVKKDVIKKYSKIFGSENATYSLLLDNLKRLLRETTDSGLEAVFFVGEFDELRFASTVFYNNLKSLWSGLYPRLHYIFLLRERVTRQENVSKWGELNEAIMQNILYIPLCSKKNREYIIDRLSKQYNVNVSEAQRKTILNLCGGHPYMIKVALRFLAHHSVEETSDFKVGKLLSEYYELQSVARGILDVRSEREKKVLLSIATEKGVISDLREILTFLKNLELIKETKEKGYQVFGQLFKDAILNFSGKRSGEEITGNLQINKETGAVLINGKTVEEAFTRQEYSVLSSFLKNDNKLFSRDEIGEVLWGKESYEKYSDWAIDQLMSKLRKKLKKFDSISHLTTVRGRGYKLVTP